MVNNRTSKHADFVKGYLQSHAPMQVSVSDPDFKALATKVDVSVEYLWRIFRGEYVPSVKVAKKIERATKGGVRAIDILQLKA